MKRQGNLWPQVVNFGNLIEAASRARRRKSRHAAVIQFDYRIEEELIRLMDELIDHTYEPGPHHAFYIYEPKKRMISASPYRDRVVHHALCNVIGPIFERTFTGDSFANRVGYGTHRALRRFTEMARSRRYILQCDVRKYFPSIDHEILKGLIRRKIKCAETLWLIDRIIDASNMQEESIHYFPGDDLFTPHERRHGLPIGNLTSQFFANIYLNGLDHFVKEELRCADYVRYVDDFAIFSDDRQELAEARIAIESHLEKLRLRIHPIKSQLFEVRHGACFLGFNVLPDRIRVRGENLRRARRRFKRLQARFAQGEIGVAELTQSIKSWSAHLAHGDTWRLRETIFAGLAFASR